MNAATEILSLLIMDFEELENEDRHRRGITIFRLEGMVKHLQNGGVPPDVESALEDAGYRHVL